MRTLTEREKKLLQILTAVIATAAVFFLVINPLIKLKTGNTSGMQKNISDLTQIDKLYQEYRDIREQKNNYMAQLNRKDSNITALVEQWAAAAKVTRNIADTRSTQTNIQNKYIKITTTIKLDSVAIEPLLNFIYHIESSNLLLKINYIRIHEAIKGRDTYDVSLKISNFMSQ
ncbi:MAG TPA: type II secretion system protein GspM [Spirochaetota bacterium]|nr:type II secretion system protein GspM [Spirochaetota bacterium]HPJ36816.1 type II secretion system protein GspM [Spirochaetota bacterium]